MVQTLYRAKAEDDGRWLYGTLMYAAGTYFIVDEDAHWDYGELMGYEEVLPETIGRNVTRSAFNADTPEQELYQGDIIEVYRRHHDEEFISTCIVVDDRRITEDGAGRWFTQDTVQVKVIGNVHDNPEIVGDKYAELYKHYHCLFEKQNN